MRSGFETCEPKKLASLISDSEVLPASGLSEEAGTTIGRYKLLQLIGEGGFGSVFMAEQETPVVRKVALKIIKLGMDTKQVIARFEAERQALAMMDHTNIAKVFDAGATDAGRPYFVMELVKGIPITDYCDQQKFSLRQRLELFIPVCKAVQHAHQKGIIHRDLKPSNVLVTLHDGIPIPKVIDFGIAKATDARLTEHTLFTEYRQFIGTPEYISPEQADISALDVDTRSDVYSLGVLLYQLLTGTTPFESKQLRNIAYAEIQRIIREVEPPKPSTRLSTIATSHDTRTVQAAAAEPKRLSRLVAGELDWIVMKCLEKDRTRRYDTAVALADDIQRHLSGDAVEASPPSKVYRLRKFARKHHVVVTVVSLLLAATLVSTWQAVRATKARNAEAAERRQSEAVAGLLESLFDAPNPYSDNRPAPDLKASLTAELAQMTSTLETDYHGAPLVRARLRNAIGMTELGLGEHARALMLFRAAAEEFRQYAGADDPKTLKALNNVAKAMSASGQLIEAITLFEQVRKSQVAKLGPEDADTLLTLRNLASAYHDVSNFPEMVRLLEHVRDQHMQTLGSDNPTTLTTTSLLADGYRHIGRGADAIRLLEQVRDEQIKTLGRDHQNTCTTLNDLALAYEQTGQIAVATRILEEVRDSELKTLGPNHPEMLTTLNNLGFVYLHGGRVNDAVNIFEQVRQQQIKTLGANHQHTLATASNLAMAYLDVGRAVEAVQLLEQVRDQESKTTSPNNPDTLITLNNLASAYSASGRVAEAMQLCEYVLKLRKQTLGPRDPATLRTANNLAELLRQVGRTDESIKLLEEVRDEQTTALLPDNPDTLTTMANLALAYAKAGQVPRAMRLLEQTVEKQSKVLGADHPDTLDSLANLGNLYGVVPGRTSEAIKLLERVKELRIQKLGPDDPNTLKTVRQLSYLYERQAAETR